VSPSKVQRQPSMSATRNRTPCRWRTSGLDARALLRDTLEDNSQEQIHPAASAEWTIKRASPISSENPSTTTVRSPGSHAGVPLFPEVLQDVQATGHRREFPLEPPRQAHRQRRDSSPELRHAMPSSVERPIPSPPERHPAGCPGRETRSGCDPSRDAPDAVPR